ncbi:MAG: Stealth CR1 domain-containing protein [Prevotella sp.]|nr:Stealth CR1 domain-containing protein [Prevotella sp.]
MTEPIDFVVTWVDNSDPEWLAEKQRYEETSKNKDVDKDNGIERYRDWGLFLYWFRAVEKFAPWVNKVYLVTCGHIPAWININHPKLVIVNHKDFMDEACLPTFNCNSIENNLHKITGLNEHFVYFNDDMFLTQPVKPEDFFQEGKPLVCSVATPVQNSPDNSAFNHMMFSDIGLVNCYDWEAIIEKRPEKWFSHCNGVRLMYNWYTYQQRFLTGVYFTHMPQAFRKTTFAKMWNRFGKELDETCRHRFRTPLDLTHFVFTLHEIADSDYVPMSPYYYGQTNGNNFKHMHENPYAFADYIRSQRFKAICVNDSKEITNENYERINACIHNAFKEIFPTPSLYEK